MVAAVFVVMLAVVALVAGHDHRLSFNSLVAEEESLHTLLAAEGRKDFNFNSILAQEEKSLESHVGHEGKKSFNFNSFVKAQDYCKMCHVHTACLYKGDGEACGKKIRSGLTKQQQVDTVRAHNTHRRKIALGNCKGQLPAANMREMVWDTELALIAQRWADQCIYEHDQCRNVSRFDCGQNMRLYANAASLMEDKEPDWNLTVYKWFEEHHAWKSKHTKSWVKRTCTGHFTQLAWANSHYLGCGLSVFPDGFKIRQIYVCNYGPKGNIRMRPVYKVGKACSDCPSGTVCKDGLCGVPNNVNQPIWCSHNEPCPGNMFCSKGVCVTIKSIIH